MATGSWPSPRKLGALSGRTVTQECQPRGPILGQMAGWVDVSLHFAAPFCGVARPRRRRAAGNRRAGVAQTVDVTTEAVDRARSSGGTSCRAHSRAYRAGTLIQQGFDVDSVSELLEQDDVVLWLDLEQPGPDDLLVITKELGLHPLAVEDAVSEQQRAKIDRYDDHLFLSSYVVRLDPDTAELRTMEVAAFLTARVLVTVRKGDGLQVEPLLQRWDEAPQDVAAGGVGFLVHGLLDLLVDGYFDAVQMLDDEIEGLEDVLFDAAPRSSELQRRSFQVRKSLVTLRRVVLPMREVVNTLMRRDVKFVSPELQPYYQDVYDHVLRASEWTEGLRDLIGTILETNLTLQSNRLDISIGRLTAYAAILAATTAVTGFYGQNVPYPGFSHWSGFVSSSVLLLGSIVGLYVLFKRKGFL